MTVSTAAPGEYVDFTLRNVLAVAGILELASRALRFLFKNYSRSVISSRVDDEARRKYEAKLRLEGPSYGVAMAVALVTGLRGLQHFMDLLHAPDYVKMTGFGADRDARWIDACVGVSMTNLIFGGFLLQDLVQVLRYYPRLGGVDQVVHHTIFLVCCAINGGYKISLFPFCWLILGEISTVFLEARWFLINMGFGESLTLKLVQYAFAMVFFVTRVLLYSWGCYGTFSSMNLLLNTPTPPAFVYVTLTFIALGLFLNLFWFSKIVTMATSPPPKAKKEGATVKRKD